MATYGSNSVKVEIDVSVGGALQDITASVTNLSGIKLNWGTVESTPFGVAFPEHLATAMKTYSDITIDGFYEDTATTGMHALFSAGGVRSFKLTYGNSKYTSCEVLIVDYERTPGVGKLTGFKVTLKPTGTVTEA